MAEGRAEVRKGAIAAGEDGYVFGFTIRGAEFACCFSACWPSSCDENGLRFGDAGVYVFEGISCRSVIALLGPEGTGLGDACADDERVIADRYCLVGKRSVVCWLTSTLLVLGSSETAVPWINWKREAGYSLSICDSDELLFNWDQVGRDDGTGRSDLPVEVGRGRDEGHFVDLLRGGGERRRMWRRRLVSF